MQHQPEGQAAGLLFILHGKRAQMPGHITEIRVALGLKHAPVLLGALHDPGAELVRMGNTVGMQKRGENMLRILREGTGQGQTPEGPCTGRAIPPASGGGA